jgi:hypothetical protein
MAVGASLLKILTTAGTVACAGAAGVLVVANDPKPATAPLQPHVAGSTQTGSEATPLAPLPPSCGSVGGGGTTVMLTAQQQSELQQLRRTPQAQRKALLLSFPAADRMQILAYQKQRQTGGKNSAENCHTSTSAAAAIAPDTSGQGDNGAPVITYVS